MSYKRCYYGFESQIRKLIISIPYLDIIEPGICDSNLGPEEG